jgi:hypothetical protein
MIEKKEKSTVMPIPIIMGMRIFFIAVVGSSGHRVIGSLGHRVIESIMVYGFEGLLSLLSYRNPSLEFYELK